MLKNVTVFFSALGYGAPPPGVHRSEQKASEEDERLAKCGTTDRLQQQAGTPYLYIEEIETEVRAEYESRLAEIFSNGQRPSPPPVLSRKEYIAKQIEIIEKQYKRLLCLCDNSPELSELFTDMPIAKRLYEQ